MWPRRKMQLALFHWLACTSSQLHVLKNMMPDLPFILETVLVGRGFQPPPTRMCCSACIVRRRPVWTLPVWGIKQL